MTAPSLHHVGFVVRDMASALTRFRAEGADVLVEPTDDPIQKVTCALLRLADGVNLELVAPLDPDDSPVSARLRRGGGLDHICLAVDDVDSGVADEEDRGGIVVCPPVHAVTFDRTIAFVHRRSGLLIELMSRTPPNPAAPVDAARSDLLGGNLPNSASGRQSSRKPGKIPPRT